MYWKLSAGHFSAFTRANGKSFRKITQKPGVWSDPLSVSGNHKLHFNTHSWRHCGVENSAGIGNGESQKHVVHFLFSIFSMGAKTPYSATKCAASLILTLFPLFSPSALIICSPYNRMGNIKMSLISKNQYLSPALTVSMLRSVSGSAVLFLFYVCLSLWQFCSEDELFCQKFLAKIQLWCWWP